MAAPPSHPAPPDRSPCLKPIREPHSNAGAVEGRLDCHPTVIRAAAVGARLATAPMLGGDFPPLTMITDYAITDEVAC